jgi:hypothetical protein
LIYAIKYTITTGLDGRVKALKDEFGARTREAETLRSGLERAQGTLDKAQSLIGQLGGEQVTAEVTDMFIYLKK